MVGRRHLVALVDRDVVKVSIERGREVEGAGEIRYSEGNDLERGLTELASSARQRGRITRADLLLGPGLLQRRLLTELPSVRPGVLRELVQQQQQRFFRRNGKPLVTDARWERSVKGTERRVVAVAADEGIVEAAIAGIVKAGLVVRGVTDDKRYFNLIPAGTAAIQRQRQWRQTRMLLGVSTALWLGIGMAHWVRLRTAERTFDVQLERLAPAAAGVRQARRRLLEAEELVAAVDAADSARSVLRLRLARTLLSLPDSAYLSSLTLDLTGAASMSGVARDAAAVVVALEQNGGLSSVRLDGTPMIDGAGGRRWERFSLQAGVQHPAPGYQ